MTNRQVDTRVLVMAVFIRRVDPKLVELVHIHVIDNKRTRLAITRVLFVHAIVGLAQQIAVDIRVALLFKYKYILKNQIISN